MIRATTSGGRGTSSKGQHSLPGPARPARPPARLLRSNAVVKTVAPEGGRGEEVGGSSDEQEEGNGRSGDDDGKESDEEMVHSGSYWGNLSYC